MKKRLMALAYAAFVASAFPADSVRALTAAEIAARPRRPTAKTKLPADSGIFIGSGVYPSLGRLRGTGYCFTYWEPKRPTYGETIELCAKEKVGNLLQFWRGGAAGVSLARMAREKGIASVFLYGIPGDTDGDTRRFAEEMGDWYLGYDFGERFSLNVNDRTEAASAGKAGVTTLQTLADDYVRRVHEHVAWLHDRGVGNVQATSSNFGLDYEVAAGAEVPCVEDFPFGDLNLASALSRGLYRQYDLPMWGSHLAHEWYSWLPYANHRRLPSLETALRLKYMAGSKMIVNESGNWQLQSSLAPDSPMGLLPILRGNPPGMYAPDDPRGGLTAETMKEAERKFAYIDVRSPVVKKYRRILSDFYAFCLGNPCPAGQPEATVAIAKGNLDLGSARHIAGYAVCNAYSIADEDNRWYHGLPEKSWETVLGQLLPRPPIFAPDYNLHFSGTPFGQVDIASFALDNMTAGHLLRNYKVLIFSGWNTCSSKQYKVLCDYVAGGGVVALGICHLSTNMSRNFTSFSKEELVNGGDFTDLCNLKVEKKGDRFFWATGPRPEPNKVGFAARRRWGYMGVPLADISYTGRPEDYEVLAADDETERPVVVEIRKGRGRVVLLAAWAYPAAVNQDWGCGARVEQRGMMGEIYRYVAKLGRGNVYITGSDFENPDTECDYIAYSYFPDVGRICLLNLDYEKPHGFVLHQFGDKEFLTLGPGEFRLLDSVKLEPDEKLNAE